MPIIKRATTSIILKYIEHKKERVLYIHTCTKNKATRTTEKERKGEKKSKCSRCGTSRETYITEPNKE